jgi:hypothetical protein
MQTARVLTEADLRAAYRKCAMRDLSYEQAMAIPAMAIAIRLTAESTARRNERQAEQQRQDRKRAQANDLFDQ